MIMRPLRVLCPERFFFVHIDAGFEPKGLLRVAQTALDMDSAA